MRYITTEERRVLQNVLRHSKELNGMIIDYYNVLDLDFFFVPMENFEEYFEDEAADDTIQRIEEGYDLSCDHNTGFNWKADYFKLDSQGFLVSSETINFLDSELDKMIDVMLNEKEKYLRDYLIRVLKTLSE